MSKRRPLEKHLLARADPEPGDFSWPVVVSPCSINGTWEAHPAMPVAVTLSANPLCPPPMSMRFFRQMGSPMVGTGQGGGSGLAYT